MTDQSNMIKSNAQNPVWREIVTSWIALKLWVKAWLILLNIVLLACFVFIEDPIGWLTAISYFLTGVILLSIMIPQRGLSRLLGVGHIIPWVPLMVYLWLRMSTNIVGSQLIYDSNPALFVYAIILIATLGFCLFFDFYDVLRWIRGERYIMGSKEAVEAGASLPAKR